MTFRLLINGALVDGAASLDVVNPATGAVFERCARADAAQLDEAVAAARQAFPAWAALGYAARRATLEAWADAIKLRASELARLLTQEQGKPLAQAQAEVAGGIAALRTFAAMELHPRILRESPEERIVQHRTPLGVVAAITPWNYPVLLLMLKIVPALITGNTVVAKPAPTTPLTSLLLAEIGATILPPGVLNMIVDANDLGDLLTRHQGVAKVSFTGSTATGRRVMESVAGTIKRLTLELGGNDAAIVLDDADVKRIAPSIFHAATINAGQVCFAVKRVYAPASLYDQLCDELARLAGEAVVDDGLKQGTAIGPVQNKRQYEKLLGYLDDARADGRIIAGGAPLAREGYFIAPTIVRDIPDDSRLVREEQFGPVLPVLSYDDVEDAIERANRTEYGLGGTIWTSDPERAFAIAERIDSGTVWINKHLDLPFDIPFEGAKQSGFSHDGLEEYTQTKIINMAL